MEIVVFIVGLGIGALIMHLRGAQSSTEQSSLFSKLSPESRKVILADPRTTLTAVELVRLIDEQIFEPIRQEALPYITCPRCSSKDVTTHDHPSPSSDEGPYYTIECNACKFGRPDE